MAEVSVYDPSMLLWIDESGCDQHAYSIRGKPQRDHRLLSRRVRYSSIPIMSLDGVHDLCLVEGSVNGEKFDDFVRNCLIPILQPFNG